MFIFFLIIDSGTFKTFCFIFDGAGSAFLCLDFLKLQRAGAVLFVAVNRLLIVRASLGVEHRLPACRLQ